ncbi:MAG: hypothetical protein HUJ72_09070 [Blautia sp.]|nr:hypothetical protein [Blautia sp.]
MKAFKGCINPECKAYKKIHYKKDDQFCLKCGTSLSYVCAECWKPMENGDEKYCISCSAEKEQKKAENWDNVKKVGGGAVAAAGAAIVAVPKLIKDSDNLAKNAKKAADAAAVVIKLVKK